MVNFYSFLRNVGEGKFRSTVISVFAVALVLFSVNANAQQLTVTGTVTDANGPMVGVTVIEKGNETNGVMTDIDGKYSIKVPASAEIVFESIGYQSQTVKVGSKTVINVKMEESTQRLDDVVVTAYGTQKRASIVGAIQSVEPENLDVGTTSNISNTLAGQIAGIIAYRPSGEPGYDASSFWIRGISSYQGTTTPLVLVDGIERTLDDLDVEQIESFSVLKDASASAMYGVRGANGVIVITTKRGKIGKPSVNFRIEQSIQTPTMLPEFAGAADYMDLLNELYADEKGEGSYVYAPSVIERTRTGYDPELYPDVNWLESITNNLAENTRATLNVNGGSEILRYSLVATYFREHGIMAVDPNVDFDTATRLNKFTVRSNVDVNITKTTLLGISIGGYLQQLRKSAQSTDTAFDIAFQTPSFVHPPIYDNGAIPIRSGRNNPWAEQTQKGYSRVTDSKLETLVTLDQKLDFITEGLSANVKFAFDNYQSKTLTRSKTPDYYNVATTRDENGELILEISSYGQEFLGTSASGTYGNNRTYLEGSIHYNRTFGQKHNVEGLLLYMQDSYDSGSYQPYRHQGFSGRLSYNFDNRYVAEFNFGYNGSENFAKGQRYGFFPSGAIGWIISEEPFFKPAKHIFSTLKLRASLGLAGNDQIGGRRFAYITTIKEGQDGYTWGYQGGYSRNGVTEGDPGISDLSWETVRKANVGIEIGLFNELNLQFDVFDEYRTDIFIQRSSIPTQNGFISTPYANYGIVDNKGFEAALTWSHRFNKDFYMQLRGTASYAKNWVRERDEAESLKGTYRSATNRSVNEHYGYIALRLYEDADFINGSLDSSLPQPELGATPMPGDIMYADLNGDGVITEMDKTYLGHTTAPRFVYGFGGNFVYKNLDFNVFFQGVGDAYKIIGNGSNYFLPGSGQGILGNPYSNYQDRWTVDNPSQDVFWPRLHYTSTINNLPSTWWLKNMSFLRLKNVEIGYSLPKSWIEKIRLKKLRVYVSGNDLLTFSPFDMWDPEIDTATGLRYPGMKSVVFGIDLNF